MDFNKKICQELCKQLLNETITNVDGLEKFIEDNCKKYERKLAENEKNVKLNREIEYLTPIILPLSFREVELPKNYKFNITTNSDNVTTEDMNNARKYIEYLNKMHEGLMKLYKARVKFFSIFLGVGTGKHYKKTAEEINQKIQACTQKLNSVHYKAIKNEVQKHCEDLCDQLASEKIKNTNDLDAFIKQNFNSYTAEAMAVLQPVYDALVTNDSSPNSLKHKEYLESMSKALDKLANPIPIDGTQIRLDIGAKNYYKHAKKEIDKELAKIYNELQDTEAGIFQGLKNGHVYCYLNTALQELFDISGFRGKVLASTPPETEEFKELRATKFFFECILGKIKDTGASFDEKRREMAGHLGYTDKMENSATAKTFIERACREQLRKIKDASTSQEEHMEIPGLTDDQMIEYGEKYLQKFNPPLADDLVETAYIIFRLYDDESIKYQAKSIREQVLEIKESDFFLNNAYNTLEEIWEIFQKISKNEYDQDLRSLLAIQNQKNWSFLGLKNRLQEDLKKLLSAKHSRSLYDDSSIMINHPNRTVLESLREVIRNSTKLGRAYLLALKKKRFSVVFSDRTDVNHAPRKNFSVEETLDLKTLVEGGQLKIFIKGNEEHKSSFRLVSASIGTGSHYYVYKRVGSSDVWREFNDNDRTNRKLTDRKPTISNPLGTVRDDINGRCETLTYELI